MGNGWAFWLAFPAVVVAVMDWRKGMFAMLAVAFLQDPARKLELGTPVYFTLLAGFVFIATYLRAQLTKPFWPTQVPGWNRYLKKPSIVFALLLAAQAINSIVTYGNPVIAAIGALSYLGPLPAMLLGFHFAVKTGRAGIQRWLTWYVVGALLVLPSLVLEYAGLGWQTLGQVGEGFVTYSDSGAELVAHSGFFRASETAAWHTATAVCLLLFLSSLRKLSNRQIVTAVILVVALLAMGTLTSRRKIFVEIVVFLSVYLALLLIFRKGGIKMAAGILVGGALCFAAVNWYVTESPADVVLADTTQYHHYLERTASVAYDVQDRFFGLGLAPIQWAIDGYGVLGGGLGIASQGAQYFGGGADVYGGAGEGGLGKVTAELGILGLFLVLWLFIALLRHGWDVLLFVSQRSDAIARLAFGLAGFLIANLSVFFIATQVFGDLFVLLLLGLVAGFFMATPVLAERERARATEFRNPAAPTPRFPVDSAVARFTRRS